jgi:hypothetical protein
MKSNKLNAYNSIVRQVQANDSNGTYNKILEDCNNNLDYAISILHSCLNRIVNEEELEGEEIRFYIKHLNNATQLKNIQ